MANASQTSMLSKCETAIIPLSHLSLGTLSGSQCPDPHHSNKLPHRSAVKPKSSWHHRAESEPIHGSSKKADFWLNKESR